jgi:hypothetical protein
LSRCWTANSGYGVAASIDPHPQALSQEIGALAVIGKDAPRANQVREHHRDLAALGRIGYPRNRGGRGWKRRRRARERFDGFQQALAVP